jgi:predicted small secreted protein
MNDLIKAVILGIIIGFSIGILLGINIGYDRGLKNCDKLIKDTQEKEMNTSGWVYNERPDDNNLADEKPLRAHRIINPEINSLHR